MTIIDSEKLELLKYISPYSNCWQNVLGSQYLNSRTENKRNHKDAMTDVKNRMIYEAIRIAEANL